MEETNKKPKGFERFLRKVEILGNKIPDPMLMFIVLALAVMLVGCASTNEPTDALSPTVPAVTVPAATEPAATAPADGILNTAVPAATAEPTATPAA